MLAKKIAKNKYKNKQLKVSRKNKVILRSPDTSLPALREASSISSRLGKNFLNKPIIK